MNLNIKANRMTVKWLGFAALGLLLNGLGIVIIAEAIDNKMNDEYWFALGLFGLIVMNSGIAFFGEAVKYSVLIHLRNKKD